jgi:hypothetical protein
MWWKRARIGWIVVALLSLLVATKAGAQGSDDSDSDDSDEEPVELVTPGHLIEGAEFTTETVYTADPEQGVVHVDTTITFKNVKRGSSNGYRRISYYFSGVYLPVPRGVEEVTAISDSGRDLVVRDDEDDEGDTRLVEVRLARNLHYNRTTEVTISYDLQGDDPRSESHSQDS